MADGQRLVALIDGEVAAYGHIDSDGAFVIDEEVNGWNWMPRISHDHVREAAAQGLVIRTDDSVPFQSATLHTDRGTFRYGPGRMKRTQLDG